MSMHTVIMGHGGTRAGAILDAVDAPEKPA
jgi:hypothetical protein